MKGYAVIIRRKDGSHFFSSMAHGLQTPVARTHGEALEWARELRVHKMDAQVVRVEYYDPVIIGPKRLATHTPAKKGAEHHGD